MESLRGVINSFLFREKMEISCPQMSFLQMLNGTAQYEEEDAIENEDKKLLQDQIRQHLQHEFNLRNLLKIQESYNNINIMRNPTVTIGEQLGNCITKISPELQEERNDSNIGPAKERKKRKRTRVPQPQMTKNPQEVESQRMNHIAVERNRRKLMNSHLNVLRSLMPSSFVHRSDQASIVAGAIDFIKELEQLLQSLQAKKRLRKDNDENVTTSSTASSSSTNEEDACQVEATPLTDFFISPQYVSYTESKCGVDVEATVVQGHVNLKIVGKKNQGQLVRAVAALEQIGLTVMHLNITSLDASSVLYSLNLKIEEGEECKLRSADEIASVVHQIFSYISICCD